MEIGNSLFERAEQFEYLRTTFTNKNSIYKEIKRRFKAGTS
jgi:hypothetical protein